MLYMERYHHWLESPYLDEETRNELREIAGDEKEIRERFSTTLAFGTGGLRGVLGAGINRMNRYTVRRATQGFASYLKKMGDSASKAGVVIAHDNRRQSYELARETAGVFAANGIRSYLFDSLRPTPELSFAVRKLCAAAGVVITASHNPPEYNGYKIYDERGCQLIPEETEKVIDLIEAIEDPLAVPALTLEQAGDLIVTLDASVDEAYYEKVMKISLRPDVEKKGMKVVYSPQHGTGNVPVRTVLTRLGYDLVPVEEQCVPDTEFSKTKNPNPETKEAFELALEYARRVDADIIITTDPDCDRLGVAVKDGGDYRLMTGNQSAAVLLEYILSTRAEQGTLPANGVMFNTVVTSCLGDDVAAHYGISCEKTLTGFKFIGDKIHQHEEGDKKPFVFGYEESYGCLIADFVRDKDAVQASLMLCEAAAYYRTLGKSLLDVLNDLYARHGYYLDALDNFAFKGMDGQAKMAELMDTLRKNPPEKVGELVVTEIEDYLSEKKKKEGFTPSNVLRYLFSDGSWVAVRPSGTEPKCKFYFSVRAEDSLRAEKKLSLLREYFNGNV